MCLFEVENSHLLEKIFQETSFILHSKKTLKRHMLRKNQVMVLGWRHH